MATHLWDYVNNVIQGMSLGPAARTSTATGTGVDLRGGEGQCFAIAQSGVFTDGAHVITFEESKNDNTADEGGAADPYTAVPGSPSITIALSNKPYAVNFSRGKRFVRAKATISGSPNTGGIYGVSIQSPKKLV